MDDIVLLENQVIVDGICSPYKVENVMQIIITEGEMSCTVDFYSCTLKAPSMAIFMPGQIIESVETGEDFAGFGMVIRQQFIDSLELPVNFQEKLSFRSRHFYTLSKEMLAAFMSCYTQVSSIMGQKGNPYRDIIIRHLFSAYYYGLGYYVHNMQEHTAVMTGRQEICDRFVSLVAENFKTSRDIGFYADKLCLTKKYLSFLLKQETGMTALEWIERHVVLYAKSCLSSTSMTVKEISNELDFPSQSVFGKYFKRVEGVSPQVWRRQQLDSANRRGEAAQAKADAAK